MTLLKARAPREWLVVGAVTLAVLATLAAFTYERGIGWNYLAGFLITVAIYALFSLGLSVEFGQAGLINFGHVAFMGVGAYTMAILLMRLGAPVAASLEGATAAGAIATLVLAAIAGLLVYVPLQLALLSAKRLRVHARLVGWGAIGVGVVVAGVTFALAFPLDADGAADATVWLAVVAAVLAAALAGLVFGLPAIRLREDYLAIVTIGGAEILRSIATNEDEWTRGTLGIVQLQKPITDWALDTAWWNGLADALDVRPVGLAMLLVCAGVVAYAYFLVQALARSPWGRVLRAIREDEVVAAALGKDVARFKLQALMLGSALAGAAGVLLAWHLASIYPQHYLPAVTFFALIVIVAGGIGNHRGAILGAVLVWGLFEIGANLSFLRVGGVSFAGPLQVIVIGVLLILVMMFRPFGALGRKEEMVHGR